MSGIEGPGIIGGGGVDWDDLASLPPGIAAIVSGEGNINVEEALFETLSVSGRLLLTGVGGGTLAAGNNDDFDLTAGGNPSDHSPLSVIELAGDAGGTSVLRGISATGAVHRQVIFGYNTGGSFTVKHQDAGSAVGNRIITTGDGDLVVAKGDHYMIFRDGISSRWRFYV